MYVKIFRQIFESSIADNWRCRVVFEDLLTLANREGIVDMTLKAVCATTRLPQKMVADAIKVLSSPDTKSRSKEHEGRRIVCIDPERGWGWRIVNYDKYRNMHNEFDRTAYMREYMRERRASVKQEFNAVKLQVNNVKLSPSAYASSSEQSEITNARVVLHFLNEKACRRYHEIDCNLRPIMARLREPGVTVDGVKQMIERQVSKWKGTDMEEYLRPETLFRPSKFEGYYTARELPVQLPHQSSGSVSELKMAMDAKEREAQSLHGKFASQCADGVQWSDQGARTKYIGLRQEIKALNQRIAASQ